MTFGHLEVYEMSIEMRSGNYEDIVGIWSVKIAAGGAAL